MAKSNLQYNETIISELCLYLFASTFQGLVTISFNSVKLSDIFEFLKIFDCQIDKENHTIFIKSEQQNTKEFLSKLDLFTKKQKNLIKLLYKFKILKENEYFLILPPNFLEIKDNIAVLGLENYLCSLNGLPPLSINALPSEIKNLIKYYNISAIDIENKRRPIKIGEPNKNKRICRFCGKSHPKAKFTKKAHAISEALGNVKIILNEECDDCNEFFGNNIEKDFILYHSFDRVWFKIGTKSKNQPPTIKGRNNSQIEYNKDGLCLSVKTNEKIFNPPNFSHIFYHSEKIIPQNFYKALCKYALSIIDVKYINYFKETVKWIKGKKEVNQLPKIIEIRSYAFNEISKIYPLILYIRKDNDKNLPFLIGELNFTIHKYIFIVPFCDQDKRDFVDIKKATQLLEKLFPSIHNSKNYRFIDCSCNEKKDFKIKLAFEQAKKE